MSNEAKPRSAKKPAAKKPAARKPSAKPAPKKPTTKKPAAKKPAAKKPAARKRKAKPRGSRADAWYIAPLRVLVVVVAVGGLALSAYWAARITFTPVNDNGQAVGNTDVGDSLRFYLDQPSVREAARQIGGNLVLLMPFGLLLPVVFEPLRRLPAMAAAAVLISFGVETIQGSLIPGRAFDIDDVILNAAGVVLAFLLAGRRLARFVAGRRAAKR